ncbi:MAG: hypothetical protein RI897_1960 [Verrucomicrobiota bacterium]|jgi:hypothetical protein
MNLKTSDLRSRWSIPAVLALTVEWDHVAIAHVRRNNGGIQLLQSLQLPITADAILENPDLCGKQLAEALSKQGLRETRCIVCVPNHWAFTTSSDLPDVAPEDLPGFIELKAEGEFPLSASDLLIAHSPWSTPGHPKQTTIAGLPKRKADAVRQMLATANRRATSISLALNPDWIESSQVDHSGINVLVNDKHIDLVVLLGGGIAALRSIPVQNGSLRPDHLNRELRITLGRLPQEVRSQLNKARFLGEPASASALFESARETLNKLGLQGIIPSPTHESAATTPLEHSPVAIAAARHHLHGLPLLFEFVAPETNRIQLFLRRYDTRKNRWIAAAMLAAILLPLVSVLLRSHAEKSLTREWNSIQPTVRELEDLQTKIRLFRPWFDPNTPTVQLLHALVSGYPDTGDVWATRIDIKDDNQIACTGFARDQLAWLDFLERLGKQQGIANLQVRSVRGEQPLQVDFNFNWNPQP